MTEFRLRPRRTWWQIVVERPELILWAALAVVIFFIIYWFGAAFHEMIAREGIFNVEDAATFGRILWSSD